MAKESDVERIVNFRRLDDRITTSGQPSEDQIRELPADGVTPGTRELNGKAMLAYFAPLQAWLKKQNAGQMCGWRSS